MVKRVIVSDINKSFFLYNNLHVMLICLINCNDTYFTGLSVAAIEYPCFSDNACKSNPKSRPHALVGDSIMCCNPGHSISVTTKGGTGNSNVVVQSGSSSGNSFSSSSFSSFSSYSSSSSSGPQRLKKNETQNQLKPTMETKCTCSPEGMSEDAKTFAREQEAEIKATMKEMREWRNKLMQDMTEMIGW